MTLWGVAVQKVLIGHPDKNFRYDLHKVLSAHKYLVIEADNGGAMFTITKMQHPNFVITADGMPSLSTEEYLKKLREVSLGNIPVIILTTRNNILRNLMLLEMGGKEVLIEPIREADLIFHLKRLERPFLPRSDFFEKEKVINTQEKEVKEMKVLTEEKEQKISKPTNVVNENETQNVISGNIIKAVNSSLLLRHAKCLFCKSESMVKLYTLKIRTMLVEPNKFDIDCYINAIGTNEFCDYSLLEVGVCHNCYFASNDFRMFDIQGLHAEENIEFSEFVYSAFQKKLEERKKIAAKCSSNMFTEFRTPGDALIANELAVHALSFLFEYDKLKYSWTQNEIFQFALRSASIADNSKMIDIRNQKYLEAYQLGLTQMSLKGEIGVRRHMYQMYALSSLLRMKDSIKKFGKELYESLIKSSNNPQLRIKSREYADRAKKYFGWVEDEKFWKD